MDASLGALESGRWTLKSGTGKLDDELSPASPVRRLSVGENVFGWKVSNGTCFDSSLVRINVADMFIPSVITPDGDGKNDYFIIGAPEGHTRLVILDRWGNQEYRSDNYLNNWDGRNNKGEELSEDTYFYILEYNSSIIRKGTILILR
jgi:gliding motility-associated-like protein